ncbi:Protein gir2 [Rhizina undulata]
MSNDEQIQEIEVLQSIYPDEFTTISDTSFTIRLALEPPSIPGEEDEIPILVLHVTYPPAYPDEAPILDITLAPSSPPSTLSFPDDKESLLSTLATTIEENLGMAMIFTLSSTLKDTAETLLHTRALEREKAREEILRKEEEKEMEKFRGELVTKEKFLAWRDRFREEMEEERRRREKEKEDEEKGKRGQGGVGAAAKVEKRMTGRELWEKGMAGTFEEEGEDALAEVVEELKV